MRRAEISRQTGETSIKVAIDLDGTGKAEIATGIGFLDHMLTLLARHSLIDMSIKAKGDLEVDFHHTVEDVGIALGQAFSRAIGDKKGITRYADCAMPMDETLTRVALDISGRAFLVFRTVFSAPKIGEFDTELVREFFQAFASNAIVTLHVETAYGDNNHHIAESCFKGLARVLRQAVAVDPRMKDAVPPPRAPFRSDHGDLHRSPAADRERWRKGCAGRFREGWVFARCLHLRPALAGGETTLDFSGDGHCNFCRSVVAPGAATCAARLERAFADHPFQRSDRARRRQPHPLAPVAARLA